MNYVWIIEVNKCIVDIHRTKLGALKGSGKYIFPGVSAKEYPIVSQFEVKDELKDELNS